MERRSNDQRVWRVIWITSTLEVVNVLAGVAGLPTNPSLDLIFGGIVSGLVTDRLFFNRALNRSMNSRERMDES